MKRLCTAAACLVLCIHNICVAEYNRADFDRIRNSQAPKAKELCESSLLKKDAFDLQYAFSSLYLNQDIKQGNQRLTKAYTDLLNKHLWTDPKTTEEFKWQMRWWIRIYFLFNDKSKFFPGRLDPNVQQVIEEAFWKYAVEKSKIARADLKYIWAIQGSENHDMMDLSNAFMALHAIKDNPKYRDKKLPDGKTVLEHYNAWNAYYKLYCDERAKHGLFVEISSPIYGKYFMPELYNIFDFAEDKTLSKKMQMLIDLTWADWSLVQLNGITAGPKTRSYADKYSTRAASDCWYLMSRPMLALGDWFNGDNYGHTNDGFVYVIATSNYRLPDAVMDLALNPQARKSYEYISLRPGKLHYRPDCPPVAEKQWYDMDSQDPQLLRYDYCTPDYIMGSFTINPALQIAFSPAEVAKRNGQQAYAGISAQNRWQGIVFSSEPEARVFPQCVPTDPNRKTVSYNAQQAVQHKNVMIVVKNKLNRDAGDMRVYFAKGIKAKAAEDKFWLLFRQGNAYVAVAGLADSNLFCDYKWDDEQWIRFSKDFAPVVFVCGDSSKFADMKDFQAYVHSHKWKIENNVLNYSFKDTEGRPSTLTLYINDTKKLPEVNGKAVNLKPESVYDSPFVQSKSGSGVVKIQSGKFILDLDFNTTSRAEH